jgi:hypothetical protein
VILPDSKVILYDSLTPEVIFFDSQVIFYGVNLYKLQDKLLQLQDESLMSLYNYRVSLFDSKMSLYNYRMSLFDSKMSLQLLGEPL